MGKIAAVVLPANRQSELNGICERMGALLCQAPEHAVDWDTYNGNEAVCGLLRVRPDAVNRHPQPIAVDMHRGVACGYYLRPELGEAHIDGEDPGRSLITDVAVAGVYALPKADGIYAFASWDSRREQLVAGVDKLGMRPLFWARLPGGGYALASEVKALVPFVDESDINWEAWEEQLTFGFLFGDHTLFKGICRLGPAEILRCKAHDHSIEAVENFLREIDIVNRPLPVFLEEQQEAFDRAMRSLTHLGGSDSEAILTLSGGFDSRRILGWLLQADRHPNAYTVPDVKFDGSEYESAIFRELCNRFGLSGCSVYPDNADDWRQIIATRNAAVDFESDEHRYSTILATAIGVGNNINFDGLAGDVLVNGLFLRQGYFGADGDMQFREAWPGANLHRWLKLPRTEPPLAIRLENALREWGDHPNRFTYFYLMSRTRREVGLAPFTIQANVMESLCPYLDRNLVVSALSLAPQEKAEADLQRPLIAMLDPALLEVPTTHDAGIATNSRYVRQVRNIEREAKLRTLRAMKLLSPGARRIPLPQKTRFAILRHWHRLAPPEFLAWELGKAKDIEMLTEFLRSVEQPGGYAESVKNLGTEFGSKPGWIKSVN